MRWSDKLQDMESNENKNLENLIVVSLDLEGNIVQINDKGCHVLGNERDELIGMNWFSNFLPIDCKEEMQKVFLNIIEGKTEPVHYYENAIIDKNGNRRMIAWNNTVLKDNEGNIIGLLDSGFDVTEHLKTKKELVDTEKYLLEALNNSRQHEKEVTALLNGTRAVLEYDTFKNSSRKIFDHCKDLIGAKSGYIALLNSDGSENEVLFLESGGLPCNVDPALPMPIRGLRGVAYSEKTTVYDNDFMNNEWARFMPQGHVVLKNVLFSPLIVEGKVMGVMGLANKDGDFDEEDARIASAFGELAAIALKNQYQMEKLQSQKDELYNYSHIVSHEVKNYINVIQGYLELYQNDMVQKDSFIRKYKGLIEKMNKFVTSQLELAKSGKKIGNIKYVDLNKIIDDIKENYSLEIIRGDLGYIMGDSERIESVFINIFDNAIKHGDASILEIQREIMGNQSKIIIKDNGMGMPPEDVGKVFNIGYSGSGTGYGLNIVKSVMESLGGSVKASSSLGHGFEIIITF